MRAIFIHHDVGSASVFWRRDIDCKEVCDLLLRFSDPDALAAVLTMGREAEVIQSRRQHDIVLESTVGYIRRLEGRAVIGVAMQAIGACVRKWHRPNY